MARYSEKHQWKSKETLSTVSTASSVRKCQDLGLQCLCRNNLFEPWSNCTIWQKKEPFWRWLLLYLCVYIELLLHQWIRGLVSWSQWIYQSMTSADDSCSRVRNFAGLAVFAIVFVAVSTRKWIAVCCWTRGSLQSGSVTATSSHWHWEGTKSQLWRCCLCVNYDRKFVGYSLKRHHHSRISTLKQKRQ